VLLARWGYSKLLKKIGQRKRKVCPKVPVWDGNTLKLCSMKVGGNYVREIGSFKGDVKRQM